MSTASTIHDSSNSHPAYALVPILGGTALILGGAAILIVDRWDLLQDALAPRPIMARHTSQATYDLHKRPHWIFVGTMVVFVPCLLVTARWQNELLAQLDDAKDHEDLQNQILLQSALCCVGGFLVAASPMGNILGTILHSLFAAMFATFGTMYSFQCYWVADVIGLDELATARLALGAIGFLGAFVTIFSIYPGVAATEALQKHQLAILKKENLTNDSNEQETMSSPEGEAVENTDHPSQEEEAAKENYKVLTDRELMWARLGESSLAIGQISIAISIGSVLLSASAEVTKVESSPDEAWQSALLALAIMAGLGTFFFLGNEWFYNTCQKQNDVSASSGDVDDNE